MIQKDIVHEFLQASASLRCLVIGDIMLDQYLIGTSDRRSPEADVPILSLKERNRHLGGAANVALNLVDFCKDVSLVGVVGNDAAGTQLIHLMENNQVSSTGIYRSDERPTTVKTRLMSGSEHLMRVDDEVALALAEGEQLEVLALIEHRLDAADPHIVILQDYNKGVLTPEIIRQVIEKCAIRSIPVAVDPKFDNIDAYRKVDLFKPNFKELQSMVAGNTRRTAADLDKAAAHLHDRIGFERLMVTLSDAGIYCYEEGRGTIIPTQTAEVVDVCGAGDAVIAMASLGLAGGMNLADIARFCNVAGGIVCGLPGVQSMTMDLLLSTGRS